MGHTDHASLLGAANGIATLDGSGKVPSAQIPGGGGGGGSSIPGYSGGRLTLDSADPNPTTDQTAKNTLYLLPFTDDQIVLYDGVSAWTARSLGSSGISLAVASFPSGGAASTLYDIFVWDNAGTPTLEALAWTSSGAGTSARATALVRQNGALVKSGATTRLYVGTVMLNGSTQLTDSVAARMVYNYKNKVRRAGTSLDTTDSWTYNSATPRGMNNGNAAWKLEFVYGYSDDAISVVAQVCAQTSNASTGNLILIGLNASNAVAANSITGEMNTSTAAGTIAAFLDTVPPVGYGFVQALECMTGAVSGTYYGDAGSANRPTGITLRISN